MAEQTTEQHLLSGQNVRQTAGISRPIRAASRQSAAESATSDSPRPLWREAQAAAYYGVGVRKFHELRLAGLAPAPVALGPRCLRWIPAEVEAAAAALPRRQLDGSMPSQLAAGKARKAAATSDSGA